jgi:hypothetical protein
MENREGNKISTSRAIIAFFIAIFVLVVAFFSGYLVSYMNYQRVSSIQDTLKTDILSTELSGQFLTNCNIDALSTFSENLDKAGSFISILEDKFGKNDTNVIEQKKQYTLLEIQHFLVIKNYIKNCNSSINTILFFYSNSVNNGDDAERIGKILNNLKIENKGQLMVYSFDYNMDLSILNLLKNVYKVYEPNSLVINEVNIISNLQNIDELNPYIHMNNTKQAGILYIH